MFVGDSVKPNAMGGLNPVLFYIPALWTLLHAATLSWRVRVGTSRGLEHNTDAAQRAAEL